MADRSRAIAELKQRIFAIDQKILGELEARLRLSRALSEHFEAGPPTIDGDDRQWLAELERKASGDVPIECLRAVFKQIRAVGRGLEQPVRVAYVGAAGSFGHEMAQAYFGPVVPLVECATTADALSEVLRGRAAFAVFPFESSVDGLVHSSITALAQTELVMVGARSLRAQYDLVSRDGTLEDVDRIYATATAAATCEGFIDRELSLTSLIDVRSPFVAAQLARDNGRTAAIVPETCARDAGLSVVRSNVGDAAELRFRYGIASVRPAPRTDEDTTSLLFSVDDAPGSLYAVLRHFAERRINIGKLQSRPVTSENWDYIFYVEIGGHVTDRAVVTALEAVKTTTKYLKILGSFPVDA